MIHSHLALSAPPRPSVRPLGIAKGELAYAAHLVPVGKFLNRSVKVIRSVKLAQQILKNYQIDLYSVENAFKSELRNHHGTHRDVFLMVIGQRLKGAEKSAIEQGLDRVGIEKMIVKKLNKLRSEALDMSFLK